MARISLVTFVLIVSCACTVYGAGQICDPNSDTSYACGGYLWFPATIRVEILVTGPGGGAPSVCAVFDVVVPACGDPLHPELGGCWGYALFDAIRAHTECLTAGETWVYQDPLYPAVRVMSVNSLPGTRIALRSISASETLLPPFPTMPAISLLASNWPAAPMQRIVDPAGHNYDNDTDPLGLVGRHLIARPPLALAAGVVSNGTDATFNYWKPPGDVPVSPWSFVVIIVLLLTVGAILIVRRNVTNYR